MKQLTFQYSIQQYYRESNNSNTTSNRRRAGNSSKTTGALDEQTSGENVRQSSLSTANRAEWNSISEHQNLTERDVGKQISLEINDKATE